MSYLASFDSKLMVSSMKGIQSTSKQVRPSMQQPSYRAKDLCLLHVKSDRVHDELNSRVQFLEPQIRRWTGQFLAGLDSLASTSPTLEV